MKTVALLLVAVTLTGCAVAPRSIVQAPTSNRPMQVQQSVPSDGAIYNANSFRPMFEDRRARHVGDLLTINIVERTSANKAGSSSGNKSGGASFSTPGLLRSKLGAGVAIESGTNFADGDNQSASNAFSGTIGVTVTEVLPNGQLVVAGEKQIGMNKGIEYIRFSGLVSPDTIEPGNLVSSLQVADVRVEYRTTSQLDGAELSSMFSRFFLSLLPF